MTTTADTSALPAGEVLDATASGEPVFLTGQDYTLTARQIVYCLAAHLALFGDTLHPTVVDPLCAIDGHMRFDGDLTSWTRRRTPTQVAVLLARAEQIARDYFGHHFPAITW
jgi:hypothetical protein